MSSAIGIELPEEIIALQTGIEAFVRKEVIGRHEKHHDLLSNPRKKFTEEGGYAPKVVELIREIRMASAEAGYFNMITPESLGGSEMGLLAYYCAWERIFHTCGAHNWMCVYALSHWAFGPSPVLTKITDRARDQVLEGMVAGKTSMCFGLSEPGAGSDAAMLKTRAVKDGDGWLISGRKIWTSNSPQAEYCIVFAITNAEKAKKKQGGISAFLVPINTPGFERESIIKMHGEIGGDECAIVLDNVRVEPWQLVGELDKGFAIALFGVSLGRVYNSARAVGTARWGLELGFDYAGKREAFGNPISDYQGVSFPLADSATEIHAAHLLGINSCMLLDQGNRAIKELSMCKKFSVQAGVRAIDRVIQVHGAMGFTNEMGLMDAYHSLRTINVADGTNEILNKTIAQRMLKGDLDL